MVLIFNVKPFNTGASTAAKKRKKYDYATKLNYLFRDARFFLVKSNNEDNVDIAKSKGVWSTPHANENRFNRAFEEARNVLLIFSVKESGRFAGLARLATKSTMDGPRVNWVLPRGLSASILGGVFKIDWICRHEVSFSKTLDLTNEWNFGKPVKIGRDGQEIEPSKKTIQKIILDSCGTILSWCYRDSRGAMPAFPRRQENRHDADSSSIQRGRSTTESQTSRG